MYVVPLNYDLPEEEYDEDEGNLDLNDLLLADNQQTTSTSYNSIRPTIKSPEERDQQATSTSYRSTIKSPEERDQQAASTSYRSTIKSPEERVQQAISYNSVDICKDILSKLQIKYGLSCSSTRQVNINISNFNKPVKDIFEFVRKATNIDLLKQPIFLIDDSE